MADHPHDREKDIHFALNASVANTHGGVRIIVATSRGDGQLHRWTIDEVMPTEQARALLTELREQADEQLQKLWPEPKEGKHRD